MTSASALQQKCNFLSATFHSMELLCHLPVVLAHRTRPRRHGARLTPTGHIREIVSMSIGTIILIILVIALLGGFSGIGGGPFYGTGYYGGGGLGLVVVVLLILLLLGKL